jgi:MFS family permease
MTSIAVNEQPSSPRPVPLWRNRDYLLLWSGQAVSLVGDRASGIAFPLLILALSHSAAVAGLLGFVSTLPYVFLSLPAGALVDRWDRKWAMILCDSGRVVALGSIPIAFWTGHLSLTLLFVVATVEGILFVFFDLSQVAALPRVVGREQLASASAQNNVMFGLAFLIGPPLGGTLYQSIGKVAPFLVDSISYGVSVISLFFIKTRFQAERVAARRPLQTEIIEGLHWLWRQPLLRFLAFLAFGFNIVFFSAGNTLLLIVLAKQHHAPPSAIGLIFAIGAIGGMVGAGIVVRIRNRFRFGQILVTTGWLLVLLYPLYALAPNAVAIGIISALLSAIGTVYNIVQYSYRLALIPDELQGRVNSVFRLVAFGGQPIGAAIVGLCLQYVGAVPTVFFITVCLTIMAAATSMSAHVRHAPPVGQAHPA